MEAPSRKPNRLKGYDYSQSGVYFITVCTRDRRNLLWCNGTDVPSKPVGATIGRPYAVPLSAYGKKVDQAIRSIPKHYPAIVVDKYAIMPNHIHLLLNIGNASGRAMHAPTISTVIQQTKGWVTKQIGQNIWQKLFHDHIVRDEKDYEMIWQYIDTNPIRWELDCFYTAD